MFDQNLGCCRRLENALDVVPINLASSLGAQLEVPIDLYGIPPPDRDEHCFRFPSLVRRSRRRASPSILDHDKVLHVECAIARFRQGEVDGQDPFYRHIWGS
jgi:hypothetical protein